MVGCLRISGATMRHTFLTSLFLITGLAAFSASTVSAQQSSVSGTATSAPLRVSIAGLVHGHVRGFLQQNLHRGDIQIVGVAEADNKLAEFYESKFGLSHDIFFVSVDEMIEKTKPQAVLIYTNTFDHRSAVQACARHGIPVMMEKPLAVTLEDAHAIKAAPQRRTIKDLIIYEPPRSPTNLPSST